MNVCLSVVTRVYCDKTAEVKIRTRTSVLYICTNRICFKLIYFTVSVEVYVVIDGLMVCV